MSHQLTLELPDELYTAVERVAHANAQTLNEWMLVHLPDLLPTSLLHVLPRDSDAELKLALSVAESEEERQAIRESFALYDEEVAKIEADWQQHLAEMEEMRRQPPLSHEEALAFVKEVLFQMGGPYLPAEEAYELAMSEEIAEWNLDLD